MSSVTESHWRTGPVRTFRDFVVHVPINCVFEACAVVKDTRVALSSRQDGVRRNILPVKRRIRMINVATDASLRVKIEGPRRGSQSLMRQS